MGAHRVELLVRDIIAEYGLACELVSVQVQDDVWQVVVRHNDRRVIQFEVPRGTPTQARELVKARLESEC